MPNADDPQAIRCLIAIPAFNEAATIEQVVARVRAALPEFDLLIVNDGSQEATGSLLKHIGVATATHFCNLGYGRAIQTAIWYALDSGYDMLITLDADGQHQPEQVRALFLESLASNWDVLIGSRYIHTRAYTHNPLGRRTGMQLFSLMVKLTTGHRIYDTTSGLKLIRRRAFAPLLQWHFIDFHAEAIVYLLRLGYRVGEHPISVAERMHGQSM